MNTQETETIELRQLMVAWLMEIAEENGVTLQELVTHILLRYREGWENSEESTECPEIEGDEETDREF